MSERIHWIGSARHHFDVCASTNDECAALARAGAPHGTLVTAASQTAGRGRNGRAWESESTGNLYLSFLVRGPMAPILASQISLATGLGLAEALTQERAKAIKWPNDILIDDKKVAGILVEAVSSAGTTNFAVVGIGINVVSAPLALATSMREHGDKRDKVRILADVCERCSVRIDTLLTAGLRTMLGPLNQRLAPLRCRLADGSVGVAEAVTPLGHLLVARSDGSSTTLSSADIDWL